MHHSAGTLQGPANARAPRQRGAGDRNNVHQDEGSRSLASNLAPFHRSSTGPDMGKGVRVCWSVRRAQAFDIFYGVGDRHGHCWSGVVIEESEGCSALV